MAIDGPILSPDKLSIEDCLMLQLWRISVEQVMRTGVVAVSVVTVPLEHPSDINWDAPIFEPLPFLEDRHQFGWVRGKHQNGQMF